MFITKENAVELARKSVESRRAAKAQREAEKLKEEMALREDPSTANIRWELDIVEEQIAHARKVLNDKKRFFCEHCERFEMPVQHMAQLLKALDSLLDRRRDLQGRPRVASVKPTGKPKLRSVPDPQPEPE